MIWNFMARGQDSINLNDPQHARTKQRMMERGEPMPPNGILTKQQFVTSMQQRMAQGGFGGPPGRFSPPGGGSFTPPGSPPGAMTFQATPGSAGRPVVMMQGGPPGMTFQATPGSPGMPGMSGNPDEAMQNFFRMSDRNQDGRIDRDESSRGLRDRFDQYDSNRDGAIDLNEYRPYIQERMASRGGDSRGPGGSFDPRSSSMSSQFPSGGPPGGWGGSPGGWGGSQGDQASRNRNGQDEEERPEVHRFGKLPKGLPSWFEEYDTDQDGQVGLYEWRRKSRPTSEFVEFDLNADGYLVASEWLRHQQLALERRASDSESGSVGFGGSGGRGGAVPGGGMRFQFQPGGPGGDRPRSQSGGERGGKERGGKDRANGDQGNRKEERRDEKKRNPFTGN
jgi:Ca2+-binding EF-hand superfamily protein